MNKYKGFFEMEEGFMATESLDSSTIKKGILVLQKFLAKSCVDRVILAHFAMTYYRRYVSNLNELPSSAIHFHMIACLSLAMKYRKKAVDMAILLEKPRIDGAKLWNMENNVLEALDWNLFPLTPFIFLKCFRPHFTSDPPREHIVNKLILEAQVKNAFRNQKPSLLALSALIASTKEISTSLNQILVLLELSCIERDELNVCVEDMRSMMSESFSNWDNEFTKDGLGSFDFKIDWLDGPEDSQLDLESLYIQEGEDDGCPSFYSNSRSCDIKMDPYSRLEVRLDIFEDIFLYVHGNYVKEFFYIIRLPRDDSNKLAEQKNELHNDSAKGEENADSSTCLKKDLQRWLGLKHPNIVSCCDINTRKDDTIIMFEYRPYHLSSAMGYVASSSETVKRYMHQLLSGLEYYHKHLGPHYSLRPETILIDHNNVLIADFTVNKSATKLKNAASRYDTEVTYRAPEVLLGLEDGNIKNRTPADIWSLGCIFGELVTRKHLFEGRGDVQRLTSIFSRLGTPSEENWPRAYRFYPEELEFYEKQLDAKEGKEAFQSKEEVQDSEMSLLLAMLCLDPEERVTATKALQHPYFDDFN